MLLSLGVSHTNELDQEEATGYMRAWLRNQPRFAALEAEYAASVSGPGGAPDTPASVLALFKRAAAAVPADADVHAVVGAPCACTLSATPAVPPTAIESTR